MIVLVGFMGAGKSTALAELRSNGLSTADSDSLIEAETGMSVAGIFEEAGESGFREIEERVVLAALKDVSIDALALGGGAVTSAGIRDEISGPSHTTVWLEIEEAMAWRRVRRSERPLARDETEFSRLFAERRPLYEGVADAILPAIATRIWKRALGPVRMLRSLPGGTRMLWAASSNGEYPVYVGRRLLDSPLFASDSAVTPGDGRSFGFTDDSVGPLYAGEIRGLEATISVPPGETAKTMGQAEESLREIARLGATRSDRLITIGGGVVGDLGGFCAATYQRGIPYVQVPTTLVAQVDSAYGGKTGVDLPEGKNYVGAFHLPAAVVTDVDTLTTLPEAELRAGMAEVVKTALLAGGELWRQVKELKPGEITSRADLIFACARYKCGVVAADERDHGLRAVLNLGHTVGHAVESITGYNRYRHGEAVALGLLAALRLSGADQLREEVEDWSRRHGLPVELQPALDPDEVLRAIQFDKKRTPKGVGFVLLKKPGEPRTDCLVDGARVRSAVEELNV
ncbi:MAG: 3-dehydroquinate synthase [Solirubrobacterales bacterium]